MMTQAEGEDLAGWIAATGKNLTTIFVTHGHGDHFFGPRLYSTASRPRGWSRCRRSPRRCVSRSARPGSTVSGGRSSRDSCPSGSSSPNRSRTAPSRWRAPSWSRSTSVTPTPTPRRPCTCRRSASSSRATRSTTRCTRTSPSRLPVASTSGWPRWTSWTPCIRSRSSRVIGRRTRPTIHATSTRRVST
ncbi:hypothetical protein [Kribbella sp. NPDC048915]|uniref:hypothetical protein n=1 Tax=Kribbella sp. NPDC048915 TaxID=3155148 RepID=UPI0033E13C9D